ncbi:MAG: tetratricopeptide repeat protein [Desulfuromonadales bacterium]
MSARRRTWFFWFLTFLIVVGGIELGAWIIERVENTVARHKNPFVESINPVPAFKIVDGGGIKVVVRSGFHPLMNPELRPFPLERPQGGLRIFVLGGSAAAGWPYHMGDTNISALLERKLRLLYPGRPIEVINVAAGTYASHRVKLILEEVLQYNPDFLFLYNGNNEFLENLVYRPRNPPAPWDRSAAARLTYRLTVPLPHVDVKGFDLTAQIPNTLSFAFSRTSLYRDDPRQFRMLLDHYRFNIDEMVSAAGAAKVPLFLLTCPVNLKDWVPNVSRHRKDLTPADKVRWTGFFRDGYLAVERRDFAAAIAPLKAALAIDDEYAEAHYRLAEALRRTGQRQEAKAEYILALQRDAFPFRELPEFQNVLREVAAKRVVPLVDIVAPLEAVAGDGIIGLDVLTDYVHLTEQSQEIVAQEMLRALLKQGLLQGKSESDVELVRITIPKKFWALRDVAAADLNYNMAMVMHQYERLDSLYEVAINTFNRAAQEEPSMAADCRNRYYLFREIHPVVRAYRDLLRFDKLGLREKNHTPQEAERIFSMYREMIRQVKTPTLSSEEFSKKAPMTPFQ